MTWPTPGGVYNAGFGCGGGEGPVMSCVMTLFGRWLWLGGSVDVAGLFMEVE